MSKQKNVRSSFVKSCNKYIFLESSDILENKNQCFHLNGKLFDPPIWILKCPRLKYLVLTISVISNKAILERDNTGYDYNGVGEVMWIG